MKNTKIPGLGINYIRNTHDAVTIGDDFALFNDIRLLPLLDHPTRVEVFCFALCMSGEMDFTINTRRYTATTGNVTILQPGDIVQHVERRGDLSGLFIGISDRFTQEIIPMVKNYLPAYYFAKECPCTLLTEKEQRCIIKYYDMLQEKASDQDNPLRREVVINIMRAMVFDILNIFQGHMPQLSSRKSRKDSIFESFIHQVALSFATYRDVAYYADRLCITPKYLSQTVKAATGRTAGQWIDNRVILEAKNLLKSTDLTIQEISQALNFSNQSFFGKYFKNITGVSPKKYRDE